MIDRLIRMGKGEVSDKAINAVGQVLRRAGEDPQTAGDIIRSFSGAVPSGSPSGPQEIDENPLGGMFRLQRRLGLTGGR